MSRTWLGVVVAVGLVAGGCGDDDDVPAGAEQEAHDVTFVISDEATDEEVDQLVETIESRIDALGIEDARVTVQGEELSIDVREVEDLDVGGIGALLESSPELMFRPVLLAVPSDAAPDDLAVTPPADDDPEDVVVLEGRPGDDLLYQLGPAELTESAIEDADVRLDPDSGVWSVDLTFSADGIEQLNEIASQCFPPSEACPTGQLAIVVDSVVQSAPTLRTASFEPTDITISGSFTEDEAEDLALALRYRSLSSLLTLVQ